MSAWSSLACFGARPFPDVELSEGTVVIGHVPKNAEAEVATAFGPCPGVSGDSEPASGPLSIPTGIGCSAVGSGSSAPMAMSEAFISTRSVLRPTLAEA